MGPAPSCPRCGSIDTIPIVYGLVGAETGEAEGRGELVIGGCVVSEDSPDRRCRVCGGEFHEAAEDRV
jgi:hypothetical protein